MAVAESQLLTLLILNYRKLLQVAEKEAYDILTRERRELTMEEIEHVRARVAAV